MLQTPVPSDAAPAPDIDTGLHSVVLIAQFYGHHVTVEQLRHDFGRGGDKLQSTELLRLLKQLKIKARRSRVRFKRLGKMALPAIAERTDGTFVVLLAVAKDRVLLRDPASTKVDEVPKEDFEASWNRHLILITSRDAPDAAAKTFNYRWFLSEIVRFKRLFSEVLVASFFVQLLGLLTPLFFQLVIDKVLVHHGLTTLHVLVIALAAISVFETFLSGLRSYVMAHTTSKVDVALGASLFQHLLALPISYFQSRQVGQSVARVRELENVRSFLTSSALTLVVDLFFTIVFFVVMWFYSKTLTLVVLASVPAYVLLSIFVTPVLRARIEEKFARGAENQTFLVESIVGVETLKAMGVEPQMQRRWEDQLAGYVASNFRAVNLSNVASHIAQFINKAVIAATLWFGAQLVIAGDLTVGQLVAFNMLAGRVSGPILRLAQLWQEFQQVRVSIERLGDILNTKAEMQRKPSQKTEPIHGRVVFEDVTFRYGPNDKPALAEINLDIPKGDIVGIVGPSGSGKSTLTKLVQRLYSPELGRIIIDDMDIALVDPRWLRRQVGVVLQENMLFNRTVRENIALADPATPLDRIVECAQLSGAHEFILELPQGYDTVLEERGSNLSGGQRQRIAIARALVTDPRILIFDEATSALDYESEYIIQENMARMTQGRTVLIIAHRLAAIRSATRIITVEDGRVTEEGTHDELLALKGRYARLYTLQSAGMNDSSNDLEAAQ